MLKRYMARRVERCLHALAASGALRMRPAKRKGLVYLAGPEGGYSSSVLLFDLASAKWQDKKTDGEGESLFGAMRRLGVPLDLVTAALVADSKGGHE